MTKQGRIAFYIDGRGFHRWQAIARNGKIVADCSEGYSSLAKAKQGYNAAFASMTDAAIDEAVLMMTPVRKRKP